LVAVGFGVLAGAGCSGGGEEAGPGVVLEEDDDDRGEAATTSESSTTTESTTTTTEATTTTTEPGNPRDISPFSLGAGDCLLDLPEGSFGTVTVVDCDFPHEAEVYAIVFPSIISDDSDAQCLQRFSDYTGTPLEGSPFDFTIFSEDPATTTTLIPGAPGFGDPRAWCVAFPLDGSVLNASIAA
jgi:hypothetical protein